MRKSDSSVVIIGAGFAGLSAGIYARMNGYKTHILEAHNLPGGLCTSWQRKGYTIDGCIHWLVGSNPHSGMHQLWEEVGIAKERQFIDAEEYMRFEGVDGRTLIFYTDVDRLEQHMLELSPQDRPSILEFTGGIRMCLPLDRPSRHDSPGARWRKSLQAARAFLLYGPKIKRWMKVTVEEFASRFKDPLLRAGLRDAWFPEFSMFFILFTFAVLHKRNAGYPLGGSLPMSKTMEKRYLSMGGQISYEAKVERILHENGSATGVVLHDGSRIMADRIISAADGHSTIYKMLNGRFLDSKVEEPYLSWPTFPPLIFVGLGVARTFPELPFSVSGLSIELDNPTIIGEKERTSLWVHPYHQDPSLAPDGRTMMVIMLPTDYQWWAALAHQPLRYKEMKAEILQTITEILDKRFPGIAGQIEMSDVATPLTFERYTGNWKGSFEGWLLTPANANVFMKRMPQSLPGLQRFYMCGQWVEPGGGLPTSVMSARRLIKRICREDGKRFHTLLT